MQINFSCFIFKSNQLYKQLLSYKFFNSSSSLNMIFAADTLRDSEADEHEIFNIKERFKL